MSEFTTTNRGSKREISICRIWFFGFWLERCERGTTYGRTRSRDTAMKRFAGSTHGHDWKLPSIGPVDPVRRTKWRPNCLVQFWLKDWILDRWQGRSKWGWGGHSPRAPQNQAGLLPFSPLLMDKGPDSPYPRPPGYGIQVPSGVSRPRPSKAPNLKDRRYRVRKF